MKRTVYFATIATVILALHAYPAKAAPILFNFDDAPLDSSVSGLALTEMGLTANFSSTDLGGFSIWAANVYGFAPSGFSGLRIWPSSIDSADLHVTFSQPLSDFSILYAPHELDTDSSATMRVTAYMDGASVGTNTAIADPPGTWPTQTLSFSSAQAFNSVIVHYDKPPPTGGDYGMIFAADNMWATPSPSAVPLPAALPLFATGLGALGLLGWRRKRKNAAALAAA